MIAADRSSGMMANNSRFLFDIVRERERKRKRAHNTHLLIWSGFRQIQRVRSLAPNHASTQITLVVVHIHSPDHEEQDDVRRNATEQKNALKQQETPRHLSKHSPVAVITNQIT